MSTALRKTIRWSSAMSSAEKKPVQHAARPKGRTSSYLGVSWSRQNKKWQVQLKVAGKTRHVGVYNVRLALPLPGPAPRLSVLVYFAARVSPLFLARSPRAQSEESAAMAWDEAAVAVRGEGCRTNFSAAVRSNTKIAVPRWVNDAKIAAATGGVSGAYATGGRASAPPLMMGAPAQGWDIGMSQLPPPVIALRSPRSANAARPAGGMPAIAYERPMYLNPMRPEEFENRLEILWFVALSESARLATPIAPLPRPTPRV